LESIVFKPSLILTGVLLFVIGCQESMHDLGGSPSPALADGDNNWFKMITESNITEIRISQMALMQSQNADVKQFAQKMIDDHTTAEAEVQSVATDKQVTLPTELDTAHQAIVNDLRNRSGSDFDKAFEAVQIKAHEETVKFDQNEADNGMDPQVKMLAGKLLDTLKMHLEMARKLQMDPNGGM
jgi:putative membrane protein